MFLIPNADRFHFGVLHSTFHNAWMRSVAGRLKGDFRYSGGVVYNNFIWPNADDTTIARIETCAQAVLDARESYQGATLADMYDPDNDFLYPELMNAHRELDAAVEHAYGVDFSGLDDAERELAIVSHLFTLYNEAVKQA